MTKKIARGELSNLIREQLEKKDRVTIIHIYDYGKREKVFDIDVQPYKDNKTEYFCMDIEDGGYTKLYDEIKSISSENQTEQLSRNLIYGDITLSIHIEKNIWIMINACSRDGCVWLQQLYEKSHTKK